MLLTTTLSLLALAPLGGQSLAAPLDPQPVVGGVEVPACGWPSVAALSHEPEPGQPLEVNCSATLVHPEILLTAAHCIPVAGDPPIITAAFGETQLEGAPAVRMIDVVECVRHPMAMNPGSLQAQQHDVGYCRLAEAVVDVPIVPLMSACELDAIQAGTEVTIVGFGGTYSHLVDGDLVTEGVGIKRTTTQTIDSVDTEVWNYVLMYDLDGSSVCNGDSGGPALVQLADGTWRVFGAGSSSYSPMGEAPPEPADNECWAGSIYTFAPLFNEWLESATGYDLTPCHDSDGVWDPSGACGELPSAPGSGGGDWARGCGPGEVAPVEATCVLEGGTSGDSGDSGDSSDTGSTGGEPSGSSDTGLGDSTGASPGDSTGTAPGSTTDTGTGTEGDTGGQDDVDDGCGCRAARRDGRDSLVLLLGTLALAVRRRRLIRRASSRRSAGELKVEHS